MAPNAASGPGRSTLAAGRLQLGRAVTVAHAGALQVFLRRVRSDELLLRAIGGRQYEQSSSPRGRCSGQREFALAAMRHHIDPQPEVGLGIILSAIDEVSACIDISDGLSTDLHHLCDAS